MTAAVIIIGFITYTHAIIKNKMRADDVSAYNIWKFVKHGIRNSQFWRENTNRFKLQLIADNVVWKVFLPCFFFFFGYTYMHTKIKRMQLNSSCTQIAHILNVTRVRDLHIHIHALWSGGQCFQCTRSHSMPHTHIQFSIWHPDDSRAYKACPVFRHCAFKNSDASANNTRQLISVEGSLLWRPLTFQPNLWFPQYTKYFCTFTFLFAAYAKATVCDVHCKKNST